MAAFFKEMGIGDAPFDLNSIKAIMLGEMAGSGAPPEVLQQMSAQLDGMLGMLESTIGASMASFPTDMAREFKQIYAANCCGKAQFIAALGAAETKLANAFRNDFANSMANMAAQNGSPPGAVASMRGALTGGTTTIIYDAGDRAVIAASNMVGNGRGGPTSVASNTNPGGNSSQAPPRNPGGNSNPGSWRVQGMLVFEDVAGRRAYAQYSTYYRVLDDGIEITRVAARALTPTKPTVVWFALRQENLPTGMLTPENHAELIKLAATQSLTTVPSDVDSYVIFAMSMDRFADSERMTFESDISGVETTLVNLGGWPVGIFSGRLDPDDVDGALAANLEGNIFASDKIVLEKFPTRPFEWDGAE